MAIPFYENEEQQQQASEEVDQVDGPIVHAQNTAQHQGFNSPQVNQVSGNQQDSMAWKILALAMCKALKDHYQQNMINSSSASNSISTANSSSSSTESTTAVIHILPNGQVKPQWN